MRERSSEESEREKKQWRKEEEECLGTARGAFIAVPHARYAATWRSWATMGLTAPKPPHTMPAVTRNGRPTSPTTAENPEGGSDVTIRNGHADEAVRTVKSGAGLEAAELPVYPSRSRTIKSTRPQFLATSRKRRQHLRKSENDKSKKGVRLEEAERGEPDEGAAG
jgi:hypothetical protein